MLQLEFTQNWNGKLFLDHFGDIRLQSQAFAIGVEVEIILKGTSLGIARIEAVRTFPFCLLSDVVSYINIGKPAYYQASLLNKFYNGNQPMESTRLLQHLVLGYTHRNIENQNIIMEDWWKDKTLKQSA